MREVTFGIFAGIGAILVLIVIGVTTTVDPKRAAETVKVVYAQPVGQTNINLQQINTALHTNYKTIEEAMEAVRKKSETKAEAPAETSFRLRIDATNSTNIAVGSSYNVRSWITIVQRPDGAERCYLSQRVDQTDGPLVMAEVGCGQ